MFGKNLIHELVQYLRRLWPYMIALGVMSAFACIIILFDQNSIEANGPLTGIGFFVITALIFVVRGLVHAYKSFSENVLSENTEKVKYLNRFFWTQITAFIIFIIVATLLLLACVSSFAWEYVGRMFIRFNTDWPYFIEFLLFTIIFAVTIYLIPIAWIVAFRFGKHKKLLLCVGIITLGLCFVAVVNEVVLLIHSPSTDMPLTWGTIIAQLGVFVLVDIMMYLLTYRSLKSSLKSNDDV